MLPRVYMLPNVKDINGLMRKNLVNAQSNPSNQIAAI